MDTPSEVLLHVLLALAAVVATGRLLAWLFRAIGQPPVIGEVVGGIVLGPSCLGLVWPQAGAFLLPSSVAPYLQLLAELGVILYMFVVGLELNPRLLRARARTAGIISTASMATPLLLGAAIAPLFYPDLAGEVPLAAFALFVGMAIAVTAFPVLARILTDRQMQRTPLGALALGCAALNDVAAWCLLALAIGVA
ncbi:MAG TPA: cation:proton antiporter, partial [Gemmataceae bacterium]|nr:cation:proton antiporter [Gemmataceae bacterium]